MLRMWLWIYFINIKNTGFSIKWRELKSKYVFNPLKVYFVLIDAWMFSVAFLLTLIEHKMLYAFKQEMNIVCLFVEGIFKETFIFVHLNAPLKWKAIQELHGRSFT